MRIGEVYQSYANSYKVQEQLFTQPKLTEKTAGVKEIADKTTEALQQPKPVALDNLSLTFRKNDTFDSIGSDSSLENLDMQKAISDMQKDKILQEYQYFVGSAGSV